MTKNKQYPYLRFIGGLCALAGGGMGIAIGLREDAMFLVLGLISLATGITILYGMSKK